MRRSLPAVARVDRVCEAAFRQSLYSRLQVASIVSVSTFKMERNTHAPIQMHFDLPREPTVDQKLRHVSLEFWEDDEPAGVAWTFSILEGEDLLAVLQRYAWSMTDSTDEEYVGAFQGFVSKLFIQNLLLHQSEKKQEGPRSGKDVELTQKGARRRSKSSDVSSKRVPGRARDEELQQRFRQGESFLDLASSFERTPAFIFREAKRLFRARELEQLMRRNKKGKWSDDEIQQLILLREQCLPLPKIRMWLRRTKLSVNKQLRERRNGIFESVVVEGPQELPPGLRKSLFSTRLVNIWQGLLESDMTPTWREALSKKSAEQWLSSISDGIPEDIKGILAGLQPPTYEDFESLPSADSIDAGVYIRLTKSRYEFQRASERYTYVGSASKYGSGLNGRVSQHMRKRRRHSETRLQRDIRKKNLEWPGYFVTLLTMKMDNPEKEDVLNVRRTVTLAEAILTVWLGALQAPCPHLQNLCQWDLRVLDYMAWSSHNPLTLDIVEPTTERISAPEIPDTHAEPMAQSDLCNHFRL